MYNHMHYFSEKTICQSFFPQYASRLTFFYEALSSSVLVCLVACRQTKTLLLSASVLPIIYCLLSMDVFSVLLYKCY